MLDYQSLLYGPVYGVLAVPVTLTIPGNDPISLTMLDKTAGVIVGSPVEMQTIRPAAVVLMKDLIAAGVELTDLDDSQLVMNGKTWKVRTNQPRPSPMGEVDGEVLMVLAEA